MLAPANRPTLSPRTLTVPPLWPAPVPLASRLPVTETTPALPPSRTMTPFCSLTLWARTTPLTFRTVSRRALAEWALMNTWPPSAVMEPLCLMLALVAAASTETASRPSPEMSRLTRSPAASAVVPPFVLMLPLLLMLGAIRAMYLPFRPPWLSMAPAPLPFSKVYWPARKFASLRPRVEATRPPTFTCAPGANITPLGLIRKTWPLALRLPKMAEGSLPRTRFRVTELALGWT